MKFRLWSLLWVMALFASALATFGPFGLVLALTVLSIWGSILGIGVRKTFRVCFWVLILGVFLLLLVPAMQGSGGSVRSSCMNNLKQIAIAINNYHGREKQLPIAYTVVDGKPAHSWRSLTLPEIEESRLYRQLDFTEPWDGPRNQQLLKGLPVEIYQCPAHQIFSTPLTSYFAVVHSRTVWPPDHACKFDDIKDGTANTILLIEDPHRNVRWYEPRDLSFDEAVTLLTGAPTEESLTGHKIDNGLLYKPSYAINVVFADAHVTFIHLPIDREIAIALLTAAGGEEIDAARLRSEFEPDLDYGKVFALGAFVFTAVWPAVNLRGKAVKEAPCDQV